MTHVPFESPFDVLLRDCLDQDPDFLDAPLPTVREPQNQNPHKPSIAASKPSSELQQVYYQPDRPVPGQSGPLAGLTFTPRAVLQLAPDLDIPTQDMMYTAMWAPAVAEDMALRGSDVAFLSRHTLAQVTGLDGVQAMVPGGVVERASASVGIVHMVERGVPGAIPLEDGETWRGQATSWTVTTPGPLTEFTHTPARVGEPVKAVPVGRRLQDFETDPQALIVWLDPRHPWWGRDAAGATGLRAIAALITRFGWTDIHLSAIDLVRMIGIHRQTAWRVLSRLADLGLAVPLPKRGRWEVRLASALGRLAYDDVRHNPRRAPAPNLDRERVHDWTWFTSEGRSVRARARHMVAEAVQTWAFPGNMLRLDTRTGRPWGLVIWIIGQIRRYTRVAQKAAQDAVRAFLAQTEHRKAPGLPDPRKAPTSRPEAPADPQAPETAPREPEAVSRVSSPEKEAAARRRFEAQVRALQDPNFVDDPDNPLFPEDDPAPPTPAPKPPLTPERAAEIAAAEAAFDAQVRALTSWSVPKPAPGQ